MALLWVDGFDGYGTSNNTNFTPSWCGYWRYYGNYLRLRTMSPRVAGNGMSFMSGSSYAYGITPKLTTDSTLIIGFGLYNRGTDFRILELASGDESGFYAVLRANIGEIACYTTSGSSVLGLTSNARVSRERWHYIEFKIHCDDTTGTLEVRVDGNTCLSLSNLDTKPGSNNYYEQVNIFQGTTGYPGYYDDFYICDGSGAANNDFLGPCKVMRLDPASDGDASDWEVTSGLDHFDMVRETIADLDTSWVQSKTANDQELWHYDDTPSGIGSIHGVQICTDCRMTDGTSINLKIPAKLNTDYSEGTTILVPGIEYQSILRVMETDPAGDSWTQSNLDGTQFGIKVA